MSTHHDPGAALRRAGLAASAACLSVLLGSGAVEGQTPKSEFGLGLISLFEHQESLEVSSTTGSFTIRDLDLGRTENGSLDGDPRLLNRKFDIEWELTGLGTEARWSPKLPSFRFADWATIEPTLGFHALAADFDLHFDNRREPETSTSLHGRGPLFGVDLETTTTLGAWFAGVGYRYQTLPKTDVEISPSFADPSFRVLGDSSRLSRDTHDVYSYVGYGSRIRSYLGVRSRWTDIEIENGLQLLNPQLRQETELSYGTRLESRSTEGIVGLEAHLSSSFIARTEIAFSDQNYGALASFVYTWQPPVHSPPPGHSDQARMQEMQIAAEIAPRLKRIYDDFVKARENLPVETTITGAQGYPVEPLRRLLDQTEHDLLDALSGHVELIALQDYVRDLFRRALAALQAEPVAQDRLFQPQALFAAAHPAAYLQVRLQATGEVIDRQRAGALLGMIGNALSRILFLASREDLRVTFYVTSTPKTRALFTLCPANYKPPPHNTHDRIVPCKPWIRDATTNGGEIYGVWRGLYTYVVNSGKFQDMFVDVFNLVEETPAMLSCELVREGEEGDVFPCARIKDQAK